MKKQVNIDEMQYDDNFDYPYEETAYKKKTSLTHCTGAKVISFILAVIMIIVAVTSVAGIALMADTGFYTSTREQVLSNGLYDIASEDVYQVANYLNNEMPNTALNYCAENGYISSMEFSEYNSNTTIWEYKNQDATGDVFTYELIVNSTYHNPDGIEMEVVVSVFQTPDENTPFGMAIKFAGIAYSMRFWIILVALVSVISIILLVVFLLCSAGHKKGYEKVQPGWGTSTPLDLLTFGLICIYGIMFAFIDSINVSDLLVVIFIVVAIIASLALFLGWLMSLAVRIKLGKWWENTLVFKVLVLLLKIAKILLKAMKKGFKVCLKIAGNLPLVWKTAVIFSGVSIINLIFMYCSWGEYDNLILYWLFTTAVFGAAVIYIAIILKELQTAGNALADGDMFHQVETDKMFGDFKKHGESLNSIAKGMNLAVEQRMKSERMKTELITNVSHDIKTPLTSIINYTDLISKEPCDNEKISEYSQVLLRQSERLKRLIEDLVEASKASTGNLEVNLAPCDLKIFLTQAVAEYEEKLISKDLQLITSSCDENIMIMADGRRLWRVFDNLMNNVCKYAQSNTRVYLSLEKQNNTAIITLKNMSSSPLNISPDELMERFVRGDSSRNTDGNGLGLSIARSLTELQNGTLNLSIDGDLFKIALHFPLI